jgi:geranylgeranyl diphosphate synthase type II
MKMGVWRPDFTSPLPDLLERVREATNQALDALIEEEWGGRAEFQEPALYSVRAGGKRIRPSMVILSAYSCSEKPLLEGVPLLKVASTVELLHTYSLIHDDLPCMDNDTLRRGLATCHVRYGVETAILTGTALLIEGFRQLAVLLGGTNKEYVAIEIVGRAVGFGGMVGGQWLDLTLEGQPPTEAGVAEIHRKKTAALLAGCCELGGLLGNADEREQDHLRDYGLNIGMAFQAVDDLLDVIGQETAVGKRTGKDQHAGKMTMTELRGVAGTRDIARDYVERAVEASKSLTGPAAPSLADLGYYLLDRTY